MWHSEGWGSYNESLNKKGKFLSTDRDVFAVPPSLDPESVSLSRAVVIISSASELAQNGLNNDGSLDTLKGFKEFVRVHWPRVVTGAELTTVGRLRPAIRPVVIWPPRLSALTFAIRTRPKAEISDLHRMPPFPRAPMNLSESTKLANITCPTGTDTDAAHPGCAGHTFV
jgi:hypothetical protein